MEETLVQRIEREARERTSRLEFQRKFKVTNIVEKGDAINRTEKASVDLYLFVKGRGEEIVV